MLIFPSFYLALDWVGGWILISTELIPFALEGAMVGLLRVTRMLNIRRILAVECLTSRLKP